MHKNSSILVIEDDPIVRQQLSGVLEDEGYDVGSADSAENGIAALDKRRFSIVITDLRLPGANGLQVIGEVHNRAPACPVLVITGHASVDSAVEAMRCGAFHYLEKPISADMLLAEVEKALEHEQILRERQALGERLSCERGIGRILGTSPGIAELRETVHKVAGTDSTTLVAGETGTGKELIADALHFESRRAAGPLVKVNCAALPDTLLESELFGHEKGAFTGADARRIGRFERADGGTLFLDEISEMGLHVQAKLLRVLEGSEFERVGGDEPISVDVRLVAATNRMPEEAVRDGKLRKDLYYRLNTVNIAVPPLRERLEDIPTLAGSFLSTYSAKHGKNVKSLAPDALAALRQHDWPGNVRELENSIERAVVLAQGETILVSDLPELFHKACGEEAGETYEATLNLQQVEKRTILEALKKTNWNKAAAARELGVYPASLYKKMKRLGIPLERPA